MKRILSIIIVGFLVLTLFLGLVLPVASDSGDDSTSGTRGARWTSTKIYYNQTFSIDPSWEADNVSIAVFVQTDDQTDKSDSSGNYQFNSGEVLQSIVNDLDGKVVSTSTTRHVLAELFTSEFCTYCPGGVGAMDRIARDSNYYPSKLSLIEWHPNSGGFKDDYGFPGSDARINWYFSGHSFGYPAAIFDGVIEEVGGSTDGNSSAVDTRYKNQINTRTPIASPIDIITRGYKSSSSGWINVSVELQSPTSLKDLKVNFVVIEDVYPAMKGTAYYRYTAREHLPTKDFIPKNHAPIIKTQLSPISISEDGIDSTSIQLASVFEDEDFDDITFTSDRDGVNKQNINVQITLDGNVTLTPDANWNGQEDITFYANDGKADSLGETVTVTITSVNDPPVVETPMADFTMFEDSILEDKFDLTTVFSDVDTDPDLNAEPQGDLIYTYSSDGNIQVTIDETNQVTFTPNTNWNGNETITFTATDSASATATDDVKIWVRSGNDRPILDTPLPEITMDEDTKLIDHLDLNDYFTDADGDSLNYATDPTKNLEIKFRGSVVSITPNKDFYGTEVVAFKATDIPGSSPIYGNMTVIVNPINDQPILNTTFYWQYTPNNIKYNDNSLEVDQGMEVSIQVTAYDPADNDVLKFTDDTQLFDIDASTGKIEFTPTNDDVGSYDVVITVDDQQTTDNTATKALTFIVNNVNDPPTTPIITSPKDGDTFTVDDEITFKGSADDPDLAVTGSKELLSYVWSTDQSSDILSVESEFTTKLGIGTHKITLTASDRDDEESSTEITITVDINREKDTDGDGIPDYQDEDSDNDGMPDTWEEKYSLNPLDSADAVKDSDRDGFTNLQEYLGDDGKAGGDDSSNPKVRSSVPDVKSSDSSEETGLSSSFLIIAVIVVIIIVVVLILLVVIKKRGKKEEPEARAPMPQIPPTPPQMPPGQMQMQPPMPMQDQMQMQYYNMGPYGQQPSMYMPEVPGTEPTGTAPESPTGPQTMGLTPEPTTHETELTDKPESEFELPTSIQDTQLLPTPSTTDTQPEIEDTPQPVADETTPTPKASTGESEESAEQTPGTSESNCPKCGQAVNSEWVLCPNCKELL
jgi:hypothetical protein